MGYFNVFVKESNNIFDDILVKMDSREGFDRIRNIYPIYFYRYIGVYKSREEYRQMIHNFEQKLYESKIKFIKFENSLFYGTVVNDELYNKWDMLEKKFDIENSSFIKTKEFIEMLPMYNRKVYNKLVINGFEEIYCLFIQQKKNISKTIIKILF